MKKILLFTGIVFWGIIAKAQTIIQKDPAIEKMVREVNSDSLRSYVQQMVSYGTQIGRAHV